MSLSIRTFDNKSRSGDPLFKALGHPAIVPTVRNWIGKVAGMGPLAIVDPWDQFSSLAALYDVRSLAMAGRYVQRIEGLEPSSAAAADLPVASFLELGRTNAAAILLAAFDNEHARRAIAPLVRDGMPILSFDDLRLDDRFITNKRRYLDPVNFATNFSLFRAGAGRRSIVRTIEYWTGYGATAPRLILMLFDGDGTLLAEWEEALQPRQSIVLDAGEVRERLGLPPFSGMLLIHAVGVAGHDIVKYVLDDVDDHNRDPALTHDSNSWPAEYYSGLPAPRAGESVRLWLQNTHPGPVPAGALTIGEMGHEQTVAIDLAIPGFGTSCVKIEELFPGRQWPLQFEIHTGNHVTRPRYEIVSDQTVTFAHMNVERIDLQPDAAITAASKHLGKGYLLPAPILAIGRWRNVALPTPAARSQSQLPLSVIAYDSDGTKILERKLGVLDRHKMPEIDLNHLLAEANVTDSGFEGHMELLYDFSHGIDADGWLHALFRYEDKVGGQMGDTSFGAHMFNLPVTFRDEPQSYAGRPPGLSSRLFARLMPAPLEAFVHLTYPSSGDWPGAWHSQSATTITLHDKTGANLAETVIAIPLNGSRFLSASSLFTPNLLAQAGSAGYMIVSDRTCRLFGYHGVIGPEGQFALDHMFGF